MSGLTAGPSATAAASRSRTALDSRKPSAIRRTAASSSGRRADSRRTGSPLRWLRASNIARGRACGKTWPSTPVLSMARTLAIGSGAASSFNSSLDTRSAESRAMPLFRAAQAASPVASGSLRPYQA